jgi:hypothetical protein
VFTSVADTAVGASLIAIELCPKSGSKGHVGRFPRGMPDVVRGREIEVDSQVSICGSRGQTFIELLGYVF